GITEFLEEIYDAVGTVQLNVFRLAAVFIIRGEFRKTCIKFFGILHLGNDQDDAVQIDRNRFDHQRNIISFKSKLYLSLLHHIPEKLLGLLTAVSKFAELDLMKLKILPCKGAADLVFVDFFNFHIITSY